MGNDPTNETDPSGLAEEPPGGWNWPLWDGTKAATWSFFNNVLLGVPNLVTETGPNFEANFKANQERGQANAAAGSNFDAGRGSNASFPDGLASPDLQQNMMTAAELGGAATTPFRPGITPGASRFAPKTGASASVKPPGTQRIQGGAGGGWPVIDEVVDPARVVKQADELSCGPAAAEMLLRDRGVSALQGQIRSQTQLAVTNVDELAKIMGNFDPSGRWVGNTVSVGSFDGLNKTGSWMAMFKEFGNKIGHFVVVDGVDDVGRVIIRDPADQTIYKMEKKDFLNVWNGFSVYKNP